MPPPPKNRSSQNRFEDFDLVPYIRKAGSNIASFYSTYSSELTPLADFTTIPETLSAVPLENGDIILRHSGGQEAEFDLIGVVMGSCLEAPNGFTKPYFPYFRRWVKVAATDDPTFALALDARQVLFEFLASRTSNVLDPRDYFAGGTPCFRPSASMLTSLDTHPDATAVDFPPLYDEKPFKIAIEAGHGKYVFSSENEVLYFVDEIMPDGNIVRREIPPNAIATGQIVQTTIRFRLLKQPNGKYALREMLKAVYVLHDGLCMEIARDMAADSLNRKKKPRRDTKFYFVGRDAGSTHSPGGVFQP